jgi:hypothetical protein
MALVASCSTKPPIVVSLPGAANVVITYDPKAISDNCVVNEKYTEVDGKVDPPGYYVGNRKVIEGKLRNDAARVGGNVVVIDLSAPGVDVMRMPIDCKHCGFELITTGTVFHCPSSESILSKHDEKR